jgi:alkanesulfonate monooxygenase SsuD/methylene tetrahydromethanopterin reductase-like flavin-dependent oxidoreductase (luciferase family)
MSFELGLKVHQPGASWDEMRNLWIEAEESGFQSLWGFDHLGQIDGAHCTEAYTTVSALASQTHHARIGVLVTSVGYRHPALLANVIATLDHITNGRVELGLGAGSKGFGEADYKAYGLEYPESHKDRIKRLDEACTVLRDLWTKEGIDFRGQFYTLRSAACGIKPIQKPHPRIIVGGASTRILGVAAHRAQEWNISTQDPARFRSLNSKLDKECISIGRDPKGLERSVQIFLKGLDVAKLAELVKRFRSEGAHRVVLIPSPPYRRGLARSLYEAAVQ